jgi:uncharacterized membrane protein (GlpM family)
MFSVIIYNCKTKTVQSITLYFVYRIYLYVFRTILKLESKILYGGVACFLWAENRHFKRYFLTNYKLLRVRASP